MDRNDFQSLQDKVIEAVQLENYRIARELMELIAKSGASDSYKELLDEQVALNRELEEKLQELQVPPLARGLVLGPSPDDPKNVVVGASGQRYEVRIASEIGVDPSDLTPGWEAWLNDDRHIIKVRPPGSSGEAAEILAVLEDGRLEVQGQRNEEIIVDRIFTLEGGDLRVGDRVRIDPHLAVAIEKLPQRENKELELEEVPDVTYADIGGLDEQIEQVREAIELPYLYHHLFDEYLLERPKGILLYGPPGCGKTMIAKAIANSLTTEIDRNIREVSEALRLLVELRQNTAAELESEFISAFGAWRKGVQRAGAGDLADEPAPDRTAMERRLLEFLSSRGIATDDPGAQLKRIEGRLGESTQAFFMSIKGPELLNKYVGETEHSIRKLFLQAKRKATPATPVIMFFDEIEALFRRRGSRKSSDVESTIVPQFLSEMDGVEALSNVIIIGATNRQDLLDPAILRPGRLDAKIKINRPGSAAARSIFRKKLVAALPIAEEEISEAGSLEGAIDHLIARAVSILYAEGTSYRVADRGVEGGAKTFLCRDFASGAMIESIVSRSKRRAVKREIDSGRRGISWRGLLASIHEELEQNKDQLVSTSLGRSEEELTIEVVVSSEGGSPAEGSPWLRPIARPWTRYLKVAG